MMIYAKKLFFVGKNKNPDEEVRISDISVINIPRGKMI